MATDGALRVLAEGTPTSEGNRKSETMTHELPLLPEN